MPQTIVITGASAGVGRATAIAFARQGARLGLVARDRDGLQGALAEVRRAGGDGIVLPADVADARQIEAAAEEAERRLGPLDVWINNAMTTIFAPVHEIAPAEFHRATAVTYLGTVYGTMAALRRMRPRNWGVIIQVGSALAYRAIPLQAPYCGAKFAIRGFTDSLRSELLHDGLDNIHLTMVQLPAINTPQHVWALNRMPHEAQPVPPIFQPEVAAEAIVWAACARRREVWLGWPTVKAILANKLAPGLIDRYLAATNYRAQQTSRPRRPDHPSNLFEPVHGWHRTHGPFSDRALTVSWEFEIAKRRRRLIAAGLGMAALAVGYYGYSNRKRLAAAAQ